MKLVSGVRLLATRVLSINGAIIREQKCIGLFQIYSNQGLVKPIHRLVIGDKYL